MKRMKKLFAILMTMAMVMGLGITGFAANRTATITVNGLASTGTNTVKYVKILEPDVTVTDSGYKFADGIEIGSYATAKQFLDAGTEAQKNALKGLNTENALEMDITGTVATATVGAGYYAVYITNTPNPGDPDIIYNNPMIVSVGYKNATKTEDGYEYDASVTDKSTVTAKYTTLPTTKSAEDEDKVVEIGSTQGYTITSYIPSETTSFTLTDVLTGATYQENTVVVNIEGITDEDGTLKNLADKTVSYNDDRNMVITLTDYLKGNEGKKVTVTYDVAVTGIEVNNTITPNVPGHDFKGDGESLYTGAITLTKTGDQNALLSGAVFNVYKTDSDKNKTGKPLKFTYDPATKMYKYDPVNGKIDVTTGDDGTLTVIGLNLDTSYYFEEVQAPEGYSINTSGAVATITEANTTKYEQLDPADTSMTDTKLAALPATGGMGTTLFTIAGCVIMISAAGLFFATRKKAN